MGLLGLTVVYQAVYQIFMLRTLEEESDASDEWCASDPSASPSSPRCLEAQLFRSWQQAAQVPTFPGWEDKLSRVENMTTPPSTASWNASGATSAVFPLQQVASAISSSGVSSLAGNVSEAAEAAMVAAGAGDSAVVPPAEATGQEAWSPMTSWARGIVDLQRHMEERMWSLPSMQRKRREELSKSFDRLADNITASLAASNSTYWGQGLAELQERMKAHMAAHHPKQAFSREHQHQQQTHKEASLLDEVTAFHRELCKESFRANYAACRAFHAASSAGSAAAERHAHDEEELHERSAAMEADLAALATESSAWHHAFEDKVAQARKELCEDPQRRDRPDCVEFLAALKQQEHRRSAAHRAERANITQELKEKAAALDTELNQIASEHRAWEKGLLEKYGLATAAGGQQTEAAMPREPKTLHWSAVAAWASNPKGPQRLRGGGNSGSRTPAVVGRAELRRSHWAGMIPKVACITPIKSSLAAKIQLKYFLQNFRLQTYEGPAQLVLVYHHTDHAAAELIASYADGFYIKAIAARGEDDFPSTTALRFGAYSSDADVIVHWKFADWHHPNRLSLQVRALAYSSRPACVLRQQQQQQQHQLESEGPNKMAQQAWDETLTGEASWMREHWHPLLNEQHAVIFGAEAHHLVEVDMAASGHGRSSIAEDMH